MITEEDVKRFAEAKKCEGCLAWHKYCNSECCKIVKLNINSDILEKTISKYLIIKVNKMSPSDQRYYGLRDIRYTRGTLRFKKDRIHIIGRKVFYLHKCEMLEDNNLCKIHETGKPKFCTSLTLESAKYDHDNFFVTDNCLFKYKEKGGSNDGR